MYKIKYEKKAKKFLKNLDFSIKSRIDNELEKLKYKPFPRNKKHILDSSQISILCELSVDKLRIYYTIEDGFILLMSSSLVLVFDNSNIVFNNIFWILSICVILLGVFSEFRYFRRYPMVGIFQ